MRFLRCLDCGGTLRPRAHPQNRNAKAKSKSQMQRVSRSCFCPGRRGDESQIHRECCKPAAPMSRYHRKWPNAGSGHGDGATSKAEARHDSPIGAAAASRRHKRHSGKARWPSFRATHAPLPSGGGTLTPLIHRRPRGARAITIVGAGSRQPWLAWPKSRDATNAITSLDRAELHPASGRGRITPSSAPSDREMERGPADIALAAGRTICLPTPSVPVKLTNYRAAESALQT